MTPRILPRETYQAPPHETRAEVKYRREVRVQRPVLYGLLNMQDVVHLAKLWAFIKQRRAA